MALTPAQVWLILGACLVGVEFFTPLPTLFVAEALGVGAIIIGLIVWFIPLPLAWQGALWLVFSSIFIWYSRRWLPKDSPILQDSSVGVTTTEIPAGEEGRVKYEGVSWRAVCADPSLSIGENVRVQVIKRQGTKLIVLPENYLQSLELLPNPDSQEEL
ncbi:MAG: NfeD family protein [Pseudanabaenaceae cyanobacterium SKYGB_i_bin29]|nr:NfeD family protein [Pseudanabaenaceae cyanobacterium SKYG29]MDW8421975.1 NfeD family protein [Pseudanabaenaceae cyanobacterium SKYGB_i_bin29]